MALIILSIGLLVFAGHFLTGFFERTKVPDVLILMLAGIVLGPLLDVVSPEDFGVVGPVFTTAALIIILFEGGIHLNVQELGSAFRNTLLVALTTFAITVLLTTYIADFLLPVDPWSALLIGVILGGTSAAVVVPLLGILRLSPGPTNVLFLESALTDVLTVVLSLALVRAMTPGEIVTAGSTMGAIARSFLVAALIGVAGAFVWSGLLPKIRQFPNTVFTTIAYVMILFGLTELWGMSGAIAALTFGIAVANFPSIPQRIIGKVISFRLAGFAEVEQTFFSEAVFLVKTFFFIYLGISISFDDLRAIGVGFTIAVAAFLGRALMVRLLAPRSFSRREVLHMTALIPKGLAAAVLAAIPVQRGLANGAVIQSTVFAVVFFSILFSAALVFIIESGRLDHLAATVFRPYPAQPFAPEGGAAAAPVIPTLGLPPLQTDFHEPNPVTLDPVPPDPSSSEPGPDPGDASGESAGVADDVPPKTSPPPPDRLA